MQAFSSFSLCGLASFLVVLVNADITLSNIPTSACSASTAGTATYTTSLTLATGSQLLSAGNLWKQPGAQWTFALPETNVDFASLGAIVGSDPGNPGGSGSKENALNLNPFRSMWTFIVPNQIPKDPYDVYFEVSAKMSKREEVPSSAKFRFPRDSGQYELDIEGTLDCGVTSSGTSSLNGSTTLMSLASSQAHISVVSPSSQFSTPSALSSILFTASSTTVSSSASTSLNASTSSLPSSATTSNSTVVSVSISSTSLNISTSSLSSSATTSNSTAVSVSITSTSSTASTPASAASSTSGLTPSNSSPNSTSSTIASASSSSSSSSSSASSISASSVSSPNSSVSTTASNLNSTSSISITKSNSTMVSPTSTGSATSLTLSGTSVSVVKPSPVSASTSSAKSIISTTAASSAISTVPVSSAKTPSTSQAATTSTGPILISSVIASSCSNNEFSPLPESWTAYNARGYMSSLLSAAEPSGNPRAALPGASLIHSDVNPPGALCTYTAHCDPVSCSTVKDGLSGSELSVQRYLAYQSVVNFNNFLYGIVRALLDAGTISSLLNPNIVQVFYTNKAPDATWEQIMAIFTPFLSIFGSFLGPLGGFASAAIKNAGELFKVAAQVGSSVTAGNVVADIKPVVDKRFTEYAGISDFIGEYLKAVVAGVEHAYNDIIGTNASIIAWTGTGIETDSDIVRDGYFGGGVWVDSDYTIGLENNLLQRFIRIFTYKAINFAWIDSGCFVIYVPYGRSVKGTDGKVIEGGVDQHWCQTQLQNNDHLGVLTVCDAPGGMARIVNSDTFNTGQRNYMGAYPQGFDNNFAVLPGENLDVAGAIRGSVASWLAGDFGYDASNPYNQSFASGNGLPIEQIETLANLTIAPATAGFFNVPVCETFDLRYFPPASNARCVSCGFGGTPGSTKRFSDNVNSDVQKAIAPPPSCVQAYLNTICTQQCPDDLYGPVKAQQNAAGYSPGWCGVHVIQYQRNEGPGKDPSQFRLTVTINDGESININVPAGGTPGQNTLVEAPNGVKVGMTSRLPAPLMISVGPGDYDPVLFEYPGNAPWGSNDQPHHCNFGKYDNGKREGDCGFSCA